MRASRPAGSLALLILIALWALLVGGVAPIPWSRQCPSPERIALNRSGPTRLTLLPGMGPARAALVVAERERGGPYRSLADLARRVRGVGPVLIRNWEPFITLE